MYVLQVTKLFIGYHTSSYCMFYHPTLLCVQIDSVQLVYTGANPAFLKEGASQADMTDVQSKKSAEELLNMQCIRQLGKLARHNWLTDCFNRIVDCSIRVSNILQCSWQGTTGNWFALPGSPFLAHPLLRHCPLPKIRH